MRWLEAIAGVTIIATAASLTAAVQNGKDSKVDAYQRSYQYEASQNYADAIKALVPVYQASARDYLVNLRLGWLYYLSGAYANSQQYYQAAISASPAAVEPRIGYLLPLLAQGRYDAAEVAAREALKLDPDNYLASLRLTYALRLQGKFSSAETVNKQMIRLYPSDKSFNLEIGFTALGQKKNTEARNAFQQVLLVDPENADAKAGLSAVTGR